jgi:ketosteroid isomerase-like protein
MIGAILAKRAAANGYVLLTRQDLDAIADSFHEDAVWEYPGETLLGGRIVGRPAIREWFRTYFDLMPETRFTVRHTAVENIFALAPTNSTYVEYELDQVDRSGSRYHVTGVTAFHVERGKIRHARDYVFDQGVEAAAYPHKEAALPDG